MRYVYLIILPLWLSLMSCGQRSETTSSLQTIFGPSSIQLINAQDKRANPSARSVGNIMRIAVDPPTQERFAFPKCSGIALSKNLVLTAFHCVDSNLIFDQNQISQDSDVRLIKFHVIGDLLRLAFEGEMIPQSLESTKHQTLDEPIAINKALDFAIFRNEATEHFLDLKNQASLKNVTKLSVYGHPHGVPFSKADDCTGRLSDDKIHFLHDCDSLPGTSGGLVSDELNRPLALHQQGPMENSGKFFETHGRSETAEEFAEHAGCNGTEPAESSNESQDQSHFATCLERFTYNRSLPLSVIWDELKRTHPKIYSELFPGEEISL